MMYFEDFDAGQQHVSGMLKVEADAVHAFASEFDPQPFHLDAAAAEQSIFGRIAASGWHTAAMTMRMIVDSPMQIAGGNVGLGGEIAWPMPTYPGDELHVVGDILAVRASRSKPDIGIVTIRFTTLNQNDMPVQIATMKILAPRRPDQTA